MHFFMCEGSKGRLERAIQRRTSDRLLESDFVLLTTNAPYIQGDLCTPTKQKSSFEAQKEV